MEHLIIRSGKFPFLQLRTIGRQDLEALRIWKNRNRERFFFRQHITEAMQEEWYGKYLRDNNGYMFMIEEHEGETDFHVIGCMGYRQGSMGEIDLYNIIRGRKSKMDQSIAAAMKILISFISIWDKHISCKVLNDNPAMQWYMHIGFEKEKQYQQYSVLIPGAGMPNALDIQVIRQNGESSDGS